MWKRLFKSFRRLLEKCLNLAPSLSQEQHLISPSIAWVAKRLPERNSFLLQKTVIAITAITHGRLATARLWLYLLISYQKKKRNKNNTPTKKKKKKSFKMFALLLLWSKHAGLLLLSLAELFLVEKLFSPEVCWMWSTACILTPIWTCSLQGKCKMCLEM